MVVKVAFSGVGMTSQPHFSAFKNQSEQAHAMTAYTRPPRPYAVAAVEESQTAVETKNV